MEVFWGGQRWRLPVPRSLESEFEDVNYYLGGGGGIARASIHGGVRKIQLKTMSFRWPSPDRSRISGEYRDDRFQSFVDVLLKLERLGSVEEIFCQTTADQRLFALLAKLMSLGLRRTEAYVEHADGHLPTIPAMECGQIRLTSRKPRPRCPPICRADLRRIGRG